LRERIACALRVDNDERLFRIVGLFFSLHDFGKFDVRFQSKIPEIRDEIWFDLNLGDLLLSAADISEFDHGKAGYDIFVKHYLLLLGLGEPDNDLLDNWKHWIAAVAGHHGVIPRSAAWRDPLAENPVIEHDNLARKEWFEAVVKLFGKNYSDIPILPQDIQSFIAGFCCVSDWIASNELFVRWIKDTISPAQYFKEAVEYCRKTDILKRFGIVGRQSAAYQGIKVLLLENNSPRQIQTLIDDLPSETSLTIIEGATGSGKTEAALALAWKLIDSGHADSIVFALPTQATADAMLERLQNLAPVLFTGGDANLVLAHGRAKYNKIFANLKTAGKPGAGKIDQGSVQCAEWISKSRKLVFLGQIGVCTIDQVLLSVLPIRHNFIRSFGIMKSVLVIDEVHAYDRYMYGLLEEVLKRQRAADGSAILLSATLPAVQKKELFEAWQSDSSKMIEPDAAYPLISRLDESGSVDQQTIDAKSKPLDVNIDVVLSKYMEPDENIYDRLLSAAQNGATVAVVCNLVQSAQQIARRFRGKGDAIVDVFHARYRYKDRQAKEEFAKDYYGKKAPRTSGRILVATQVVEQSLDLDFDWLITQLCPVDLLFQRIGRLHRHERRRPKEFGKPFCTVIINESDDFGAHEIIYGDTRVLWRTRELLKRCRNVVRFPQAYRDWIEKVYGREEWEDKSEPDSVIGKSCAFREMQKQMWYEAQQRAANSIVPFADTDQNAASLTRGKEMGLNVVPVIGGKAEKTLLDGERRSGVNEFEWEELLDMNSIPVPASWKPWLPCFEEGYVFLPMVRNGEDWHWEKGNIRLTYSTDFGLERSEEAL